MKKFLIGKKVKRKELIWSILQVFIGREILMYGIREALISGKIIDGINISYYTLETILFILICLPGFSLSKGRYWCVSEKDISYVGPTSIFNDLKELYYFIVKKQELIPNWKVLINNIEKIDITAQKRLLLFATIGYPIYLKLTLNDGSTNKYWVIENNQLVTIIDYLRKKEVLIVDSYKIIDALADPKIDINKYLAKQLKNRRLII